MWVKQLTDAANASYDPILEQANIQLPIPAAALASADFTRPSSAQHQCAFLSATGSAGDGVQQQIGDLTVLADGNSNGNGNGNGDSDDPSPQLASHSDQIVPLASTVIHHRSHADLLGLSNLCNVANGGGAGGGIDAAKNVKDHMNLVFGDSVLPRVVMSQGWMSYGPLTEPLSTTSVGHINTLGPNSGSPIATTSSSLSGLDLSGLAMGGSGSRSGGITASIPVGLTSAGLLLDGMGMSPQDDPPYLISQITEEDPEQQHRY
ncbi:hypothetical protein GGI21_004619 [Coemansia aciculifera]|nr:hypothetical protein GGI21_004619 [Coemansia aciculifera]